MPTPTRKASALAALQDAEKRRLETRYLGDARLVLSHAVADVMRQVRSAARAGRSIDPRPIFAHAIGQNEQAGGKLKALLAASMIRSHLAGFKRAAVNVAAVTGRVKKFSTYSDLLDELVSQLGIQNADEAILRVGYGKAANEQINGLADKVSKQLTSSLQTIASKNLTAAGGAAEIQQAFKSAGVVGVNPYAVETVFRAQTTSAWQVGTMRFNEQPAVDEIIWGYEFVTAGDDRVRPEHEKMDGTRAAKDDPIWNQWTPPVGWGCRCDRIPIFNDEQIAEPTDIPDAQPDENFPFNPVELNRLLSA